MQSFDTEGIDTPTMFAAGACSAALSSGMPCRMACDFAAEICKEAASRRKPLLEEDEEDGEDTFWNRNKWWIIPSLVGYAAFNFGSRSGAEKRPDRGHYEGAWDYLSKKMRLLLGVPDDPLLNSMTKATGFDGSKAWDRAKVVPRASGTGGIKVDAARAEDGLDAYQYRGSEAPDYAT